MNKSLNCKSMFQKEKRFMFTQDLGQFGGKIMVYSKGYNIDEVKKFVNKNFTEKNAENIIKTFDGFGRIENGAVSISAYGENNTPYYIKMYEDLDSSSFFDNLLYEVTQVVESMMVKHSCENENVNRGMFTVYLFKNIKDRIQGK